MRSKTLADLKTFQAYSDDMRERFPMSHPRMPRY